MPKKESMNNDYIAFILAGFVFIIIHLVRDGSMIVGLALILIGIANMKRSPLKPARLGFSMLGIIVLALAAVVLGAFLLFDLPARVLV